MMAFVVFALILVAGSCAGYAVHSWRRRRRRECARLYIASANSVALARLPFKVPGLPSIHIPKPITSAVMPIGDARSSNPRAGNQYRMLQTQGLENSA